jgi:ketosteroid isomerase-like protein
MRHATLGAVLCLAVTSSAPAGAADAAHLAPIQKFIDAFNKGDIPGAGATHSATDDLMIIDEVPPYLWRGVQAFQTWAAALDSNAKKKGITDPSVTISAPTREEADGDQVYVVVPAVYSIKQGGVAMREAAQMTVVVKKGASGWLIHGWTWTGPKPKPAAGAAKPSGATKP